MSLADSIKYEASRLGFDAVGIARVSDEPSVSGTTTQPTPPSVSIHSTLHSRLLNWLSKGFQATMEWMGRDPERRSHPTHVLPGCRSVIAVGTNYFTDLQADEREGHGRIARYAWGEDYHVLFKERLQQLEHIIHRLAPTAKTKWYVDTGPVMEKAWAQEAGLGWIGKHSNLVSTEFGSWLLLGEILTTVEFDVDTPGTDMCGSCMLCLNACPTGAIVEPYVVNAEKCISYLTIEFRGHEEDIPEDLRRQTGNRIFGCDDCLDICPFNVNSQVTDEPHFQATPETLAPKLEELEKISEAEFRTTFKKSPLKRAKHEGFLRNIGIARANSRASINSISTRPQ